MRQFRIVTSLAVLALAACNQDNKAPTQTREIKVRSSEQNQLHTLDAMNLAIALKRAIYDAGYVCRQVKDAGFVGEWKNLDMWMARCADGRDWAVFAGPDGGAQVRDCKDVPGSGLPLCEIKKRPSGKVGQVG